MTTPQIPETYAWVKPGAPVWYRPSKVASERHGGIVDRRPPWLLGDTWVVRLIDMDPSYRNGARSTVSAAALDNLLPRCPEADALTALRACDREARERVLRIIAAEQLDDPDFGVDPGDSQALLSLRRAIDDHLAWPSEAVKEGGDYEAAIKYSGRLARLIVKVPP